MACACPKAGQAATQSSIRVGLLTVIEEIAVVANSSRQDYRQVPGILCQRALSSFHTELAYMFQITFFAFVSLVLGLKSSGLQCLLTLTRVDESESRRLYRSAETPSSE